MRARCCQKNEAIPLRNKHFQDLSLLWVKMFISNFWKNKKSKTSLCSSVEGMAQLICLLTVSKKWPTNNLWTTFTYHITQMHPKYSRRYLFQSGWLVIFRFQTNWICLFMNHWKLCFTWIRRLKDLKEVKVENGHSLRQLIWYVSCVNVVTHVIHKVKENNEDVNVTEFKSAVSHLNKLCFKFNKNFTPNKDPRECVYWN